MSEKQQSSFAVTVKRTLRIGFVALTDCAPIVMAQELGLYAKYGLRVSLSRELGWATIRDKVVHGELDAAHAIASMPFAATLGLNSVPCECLTGLVLNLHGNAITISSDLWQRGVRDASGVRNEIARNRGKRILTFGVVYSFSSHNYLLRNWLSAAGIQPDRDVRVVVVPPAQMVANLKAGHLDGFCVGEPWNSLAARAGVGCPVSASVELDPLHPEKVLMVRRQYAEQHSEEHVALVAALLEACAYCDRPENHSLIADTLAQPQFVNVPANMLLQGLSGQFQCARTKARTIADFFIFHREDANEPSADKAGWALRNLRTAGAVPDPIVLNAQLGRQVYRPDVFDQARQLVSSPSASKSEPENKLTTT